MRLIKSYASYKDENGEWVPQRDVEMHPLEEAEILAHWAIEEVKKNLPPKPSIQDEHEWMIEHGPDFVKQKREEWKLAYDAAKPEIEECIKKHEKAKSIWHAHSLDCAEKGLCPDTTGI